MYRIYINLTNKCNADCPFCCMYSSSKKTTFLDFDKYKEIIDKYNEDFELQFDGGEPLLCESLYLFLYYAYNTKRCKKIIITTNGILLNEHLERIIDFANYSKITVCVKPSINYWLIEKDNELIKKCRDLYYAVEFVSYFEIIFNVRLRKNDDWIIDELKKYRIYDKSNVFYLQSYGRLTNSDYEKPFINKNINWFELYSCDGECFGTDLIARSEYEKELY